MRMRPAFRFWHRWFGILAGAWLILLAVTGIAIAWYDELDRTLNPDLRSAPAAAVPPASLDAVVAAAEAALPGFAANNILLAQRPGDTHWLLGRQSLADGSSRAMQVFADPGSGAIAGWRESGALRLHRHNLPDLLYGLHTDILAGEPGVILVGLVGLAWLVDHLIALSLAFPRLRGAVRAFRISGPGGSLRRAWDRHRAWGLWLWPVTLVLAVTGVTLTFGEESRDIVRTVSPVGERLHYAMPERDPPAEPVGIDRALAQVSPRFGSPYAVRPHADRGVYAVRTFDRRDMDNQGRLWTYVDMASGTIVAQRHDRGESAGDAFFAWQYPLHSGHAFGLPGRLLITLAGAVTLYLSWSGYRLWWRRRASAALRRPRARPAEAGR